MFHVGDITKLNGGELIPVECITGGSPCQDLSIAGKREGLAGERSGLFMEMIRVIKEMREGDIKNGRTGEHIRPRFVIWENVAGAFTSNRGQDFRAVLEEFCRIKEAGISIPMPDSGKWTHSGAITGDGFSIAWRLMDAQYFGVPQRRKRIAVVADLGGGNAADILFTGEPFVGDITDGRFGKVLPIDESLRGYFETSRETREGASEDSEKCPDESNTNSYLLKIRSGADTYVKADGSIGTAGKGALIQTERSGNSAAAQDQTLFTPAIPLEGNGSRPSHHGDGYSESDTSYTLNGVEHHGVAYATQACGDRDNPSQSFQEEKGYTLPANPMSDRGQAVAYGIGRDSFNSGTNAKFDMSLEEDMQPPITARGAGGGMLNNTVNALCYSDWRGIGNQYVNDGKCIIEQRNGNSR